MRAVAACFDETRAPSWYRSYRPQALGSASTLEAGPTYRATVTPESLQAAGIEAAVRHDTVVSRRRRRHATAASSDFFCVPFGGRANGRVSTPRPTPSPTTAAPAPSMRKYAYCADCGPRFPPLRPCAPPVCAETCNWASDADCDDGGPGSGSARPGPEPGPTACGTGPSSHVTKVTLETCH